MCHSSASCGSGAEWTVHECRQRWCQTASPSLIMENPNLVYTQLIKTPWLLYGVFVECTTLSCLCVFVVHTHVGQS